MSASTLSREERDEIEAAEVREIFADAPDELSALRALLVSKSSGYGGWHSGRWSDLRHPGDEVGGFTVVETIDGDDRRWSRAVEVIVQGPSGVHYRWSFDQGLTEMQDDELLDGEPVVVEAHEETVVVKSWRAVA